MASTRNAKRKTGKSKTASPSKTRKKPATATTRTKASESAVTVDRRSGDRRSGADRRKENKPVAVERRKVERRAKVNRRRQIDPTTCERDYSDDEIEFMNALDAYKRTSGRMFPTCSEVLEVIRKLGYTKQQPVATAEPGDPSSA